VNMTTRALRRMKPEQGTQGDYYEIQSNSLLVDRDRSGLGF
jgi:hypothetical protein